MKVDEPITRCVFDNHSVRLGQEAGLEEKLTQYCYRRGFAEVVVRRVSTKLSPYAHTGLTDHRQSVRDQTLRHKP